MREDEFQAQIVGPNGLATILGWVHVHFRPARTAHGWRTPGSGEMAKGWPDLVLLRLRDGKLIFVELKSDKGKVAPEQEVVLEWLRRTRHEVYVWRPADLPEAAKVLAR